MTEQLAFPEPIMVGDLKPLTRIRYGEAIGIITSYLLPRDGRSSVLCQPDSGAEFTLDDDTIVEIVGE